jgi:uncharacterized RDD family membrane protein YckC
MTTHAERDRLPVPPPAQAPPSAEPEPEPVLYIGLITRAIAFAIDAGVINVVAAIVAAGAALIISLLHLPKAFHTAIAVVAAAAWALWAIGYFVAFWTLTGQTPGARVMRFRVITTKGGKLKPYRALIRYFGLWLAALPLFAGYLLIPFDPKRRGLQDQLARTLVVDAPETPRRSLGRRPGA